MADQAKNISSLRSKSQMPKYELKSCQFHIFFFFEFQELMA